MLCCCICVTINLQFSRFRATNESRFPLCEKQPNSPASDSYKYLCRVLKTYRRPLTPHSRSLQSPRAICSKNGTAVRLISPDWSVHILVPIEFPCANFGRDLTLTSVSPLRLIFWCIKFPCLKFHSEMFTNYWYYIPSSLFTQLKYQKQSTGGQEKRLHFVLQSIEK